VDFLADIQMSASDEKARSREGCKAGGEVDGDVLVVSDFFNSTVRA
jgi:hypothetical protein